MVRVSDTVVRVLGALAPLAGARPLAGVAGTDAYAGPLAVSDLAGAGDADADVAKVPFHAADADVAKVPLHAAVAADAGARHSRHSAGGGTVLR